MTFEIMQSRQSDRQTLIQDDRYSPKLEKIDKTNLRKIPLRDSSNFQAARIIGPSHMDVRFSHGEKRAKQFFNHVKPRCAPLNSKPIQSNRLVEPTFLPVPIAWPSPSQMQRRVPYKSCLDCVNEEVADPEAVNWPPKQSRTTRGSPSTAIPYESNYENSLSRRL